MSGQRPELSQEARMAAWREFWRYLLKLPDGPVPMRDPDDEPSTQQADEGGS